MALSRVSAAKTFGFLAELDGDRVEIDVLSSMFQRGPGAAGIAILHLLEAIDEVVWGVWRQLVDHGRHPPVGRMLNQRVDRRSGV
jgi:hypothetical protein